MTTSTHEQTHEQTHEPPTGSRHQRTSTRRGPTRRGPTLPIAAKLGALLAVLVALLMVVAAVMFGQLRDVARTYDDLLATQVQQGLQARKMQVEFKKQVQEWKNILLRGSDPGDLASYTQQFHDQATIVDGLNQQLLDTVGDAELRSRLEQFQREHRALNQAYEAALAPFAAAGGRDPSVPDAAVRGQDRPPTDRIDGIVGGIETSITNAIAAQKAEVASREQTLLAIAAATLIGVIGVVVLVVTGIVRPIRRLTRAAYQAANETLPAAIARIRTMDPDGEPPSLAPLTVRTRDELADLGQAVSTLQSRALELAVAEHRTEQLSAQMLVNLGRRNQNLLGRTISYITELERTERNPEVLQQLFRLDHATTRIRRGAESMLVLAGATQTRTWSRPVPMADIARAAMSEVEDYQRVDLYYIEDMDVVGTAVADLVHLIAELVENATHFSPPGARVTVVGQHDSADRYRLRIIDQGIGMTSRELDEANARIHQASAGPVDNQLLGLHVVGRLATRRQIDVLLEPSSGRGITATVVLPSALLSAPDQTASVPAADRAGASVPDSAVPTPAVPIPAVPTPAVPPVATAPAPVRLTQVRSSTPTAGHPAEPSSTVPRRVRGAQLPDPGRPDGPDYAAPDTTAIRGRLTALQSGVRSARANHWPDPTADPLDRAALHPDPDRNGNRPSSPEPRP